MIQSQFYLVMVVVTDDVHGDGRALRYASRQGGRKLGHGDGRQIPPDRRFVREQQRILEDKFPLDILVDSGKTWLVGVLVG